ncbi:MAG: hypothetical protein GEV06_26660 [Luteitalea sp.]|nr:hypothetical protein [Luteitalea sp.]
MRKKTNASAVALFWSLAADLMSEHARVVESTIMNGRCLRVGKEFLALVDDKGSGLVVMLSKKRVEELLASGVGQPFAPAGRVFKEWVSVPKPDRRRWRSLLQEGVVSRLADEHGDD